MVKANGVKQGLAQSSARVAAVRRALENGAPMEIDELAQLVDSARIVYGGRGTLSDVQKPRYGQEIFDIIYPF